MGNLVSIIIPAYNCEKWIAESIKSALAQTWPKKEIIVVDDGSTDRSLQIAKEFESKILKVIHQENRGAAAARNAGLRIAQGDYIQWLDADDLLAKDKIENQIKISENESEFVLFSSSFGTFYINPERAKFKPTLLWKDLLPVEWLCYKFEKNLWMNPAVWLVSRKLTELAGPWDERLSLDDDGEYFCRVVSLSNGVKFVKQAITYYRVGNYGSLSMSRSTSALESLILSTELGFSYLRSLEESERTRDACLKFLQNRILGYYSANKEMLEKAQNLAKELGGILSIPEVDWKLRATSKVLGWGKAMTLRNSVRKVRASVWRNIDEMLYKMSYKKSKS